MSTPKAPTGGLPEKPQKIPKMEVHKAANPITLTRFIMQQRAQFKQASGEFAMLLQSIQLACKVIANAATNAGIANLYGVAGDTNTSGDVQKKLDVLANDVFVNCLRFSEQVYVMCSEEVEDPIVVDEHAGGYAVVFDPLDGSSNIDANVSVGTIFGIYKKSPISSHKTGVKDLLRPGNELLCGGYALYGSATMLVFTTGNGVNGFSLDPTIGEFILTHRDIVMPRKGKVYSINEGNSTNFDEPTKAVVANWKGAGGKARSARYIGSMVGDVHRTLLYGGIFAYPGDKKNPKGKLRLLYECNPIAFIMEQAGGKATTGRQRILDVQPTALHERQPIFCGSYDDVTEVEEAYRKLGGSKL